jgi:hypothetical protein
LTVGSKPIKCTVYPTADETFANLVTHARSFDAIGDCLGSLTLTLMYNAKADPKYGAFKQAIPGYLDRPALWASNAVMIKQCFYLSTTGTRKVLFDKHSQLKKLSNELNCLRWASALMGLVYDHIDEHMKTHGPAPFSIPQISFVKSALAIAEANQETFLLEEVINDAVNGHFVKYIGNGSVKPYDHLKGDDIHTAKFLSFCQHVQFLKTKGLAFVGDFQGNSRGTEPQLISNWFFSRWTMFVDGSPGHNSIVSSQATFNYISDLF